MKGRARIHAATACCRRVGSTCLESLRAPWAAWPGRPAGIPRSWCHVRARCRSTRPWSASADRFLAGHVALRGLLDHRVDRRRDLLPGGDGRRGAWRSRAAGRRPAAAGRWTARRTPRRTGRRQVADLVVERLLGLGLGQPLDVLPGAVGVVRVFEDGQVATTDERRAGTASLPGSGATAYCSSLTPCVLDQAGVPRAGDEGAVRALGEAALELARVEQPRRARAPRRSTTCSSRAPRPSPGESIVYSVPSSLVSVGAVGPGERHHRLPRAGLAGLEAEAVLGATLGLHVLGERLELVPALRCLVPAGLLRQVRAVVEDAGLDVPRDAVRRAADLGGTPTRPGRSRPRRPGPPASASGRRPRRTHPSRSCRSGSRRASRRWRSRPRACRAPPPRASAVILTVASGLASSNVGGEVLEHLALGAHRPDVDGARGLAVLDRRRSGPRRRRRRCRHGRRR